MSNIVPLDKIIHIIERDDLSFPPEPNLIIVEHNNRKFCPHEHLNIFRHHRNVYCKDCGATLDAFDVLVKFAAQENNVISQLQWLKYQLKIKRKKRKTWNNKSLILNLKKENLHKTENYFGNDK